MPEPPGRAQRAVEAWAEHQDQDQGDGTYVGHSARGPVVLESVALEAETPEAVDVRLQGETESQDPHFRVVNPPLLVEDPAGPVEINGKRFREDPLAALARVIGDNGGAQVQRGRGRR